MARTRGSRVRPPANGSGRSGESGRPSTSDDLWLTDGEDDGLWTDSKTAAPPPRRVDSLGDRPRPRAASRNNREAARRRQRRLGLARLGLALGLIILLVVGAIVALKRLGAPGLHASGPPAGALIGPTGLRSLAFSARGGPSDLARQHWSLDGHPVIPQAGAPGALVYRPGHVADGEHRFQIVATGGLLGSTTTRGWSFTVDTTPPLLRLSHPAAGYGWKPLTVKGATNEDAVVRVDGRRLALDGHRFTLHYSTPPALPPVLTATDRAGNTSRWKMPVTLVPRRPREPLRAVHVSADAWADSQLRAGVLQLIDQHRINAVELDLKDEDGIVGWNADVPLARQYGADQATYDLASAVEMLHAKGARVIGRLVAFRDPKFAAGAWRAGNRDEVIQAPGGAPYKSRYGGFANFANPVVRKYNIAIAVAAAKLGVDDVLYDYVRRPDGPISSMAFPGLRGTPETSIAGFLAETRKALRPYGTYLGASVFGVAATRPEEVAQSIPMMARQVDYISPMVYPSHWAPGEYNVANPNAEPYQIVRRSLADFRRDVNGTGARLVPWLQDFSLGVPYGPAQVKAQIKAARDAGANEFLLWDPAVTYTTAALARNAVLPATGSALAGQVRATGPGLIRLRGAAASPRASNTLLQGSGSASLAATRKPNELGVVPVLMHHRIVAGRTSEYDLSPGEFRMELQRLWRDGFAPITAADYVSGKIDVPAGKKPVVMTFDDGSSSQFGLTPSGQVQPATAVGIMLAFAEHHPGFHPAATFYVNRDPFQAGADAPRLLRWLVQHGFDVGNHTVTHAQLNRLDDQGVQKELAGEARNIETALPGYAIRTMALPYGEMPANRALAVRGSYGGQPYGPYAVMLVGANPAPSPFAGDFDPAAIPRIRTAQQPWHNAQRDYAFDFWLTRLERDPGSVYVSDGDPRTITFPHTEAGKISTRYQAEAKPY